MEITRLKPFIAPIFGAILSLPILYLLFYALLEGVSLEAFANLNLGTYAQNTLLLVVGVGVLVFVFGGLSAYLVARFEFPGSRFFALFLALPLAIPSYVVGYAYNGIFEYAGLFTQLTGITGHFSILSIWGAIVVFGLSMYPYVFIVARAAFLGLSSSVDEVVKLQGIGPVRAFFRAYLPLVYPALFIGLFLTSMEVISDYGTVLYFGVETFSVGIFKQWFGFADLQGAIKIALVLMLFVFAFLLLESRAKARMRYATGSFSAKSLQKQRLGGAKAFGAFAFCALLLTLAFIIPVGVLAYWAILDPQSGSLDLWRYAIGTLSLNLGSALVIMVCAFVVLFFTVAYRTTLAKFAYRVSLLGYSIPGVVVGIGALLLFSSMDNVLGQYWFGGTFFVLVFAYLVRFYPAGVGALNSGFSKITAELQEASKLYAVSEFARMWRVSFPLVKGAFVSGFLIVFIDISKELPATLLLRPFNFDTLATRIYELASNEMLPALGLPSLVLLSMTTVAVLLLNLRIFK
ncbi:MAG: iron ABC transporter permease [Campylobacterales bacterium]|nr:iron ABC transporter permease [Campylobacterales bacterium]